MIKTISYCSSVFSFYPPPHQQNLSEESFCWSAVSWSTNWQDCARHSFYAQSSMHYRVALHALKLCVKAEAGIFMAPFCVIVFLDTRTVTVGTIRKWRKIKEPQLLLVLQVWHATQVGHSCWRPAPGTRRSACGPSPLSPSPSRSTSWLANHPTTVSAPQVRRLENRLSLCLL